MRIQPPFRQETEGTSLDQRFTGTLQRLLAERGWTYSDLANQAGLDVSLVSRVARGQRQPTINFLKRCSVAFGVPLEQLMTSAGLLQDAVAAVGTPEANALQPYVQYASTPEGEEEIAERIPVKVARLGQTGDPTGKLTVLLDRVRLLYDWFRTADGATKLLIGGALLYFLSPVDLVPDFMPVAGLADDFAVIALVMGLIGPMGPTAHQQT